MQGAAVAGADADAEGGGVAPDRRLPAGDRGRVEMGGDLTRYRRLGHRGMGVVYGEDGVLGVLQWDTALLPEKEIARRQTLLADQPRVVHVGGGDQEGARAPAVGAGTLVRQQQVAEQVLRHTDSGQPCGEVPGERGDQVLAERSGRQAHHCLSQLQEFALSNRWGHCLLRRGVASGNDLACSSVRQGRRAPALDGQCGPVYI